MEVSNETIDDLLEVIDSLIKENTQLRNRLLFLTKSKRKNLYNSSNKFYSYNMIEDLNSDYSNFK